VKMRHLLFAVLVFSLMVGCASVPPPKKVNLADNCYSTMSAIPAFALSVQTEAALKKLKPVDYSSLAKCLLTPDGKRTPVALYRLEGVSPPAVVKVSLSSSSFGVLAAKATLLDANFNEVSYTGFDKFINRGNIYSADVFVNSDAVKYIAVGQDDPQLGKSEKQYASIANTLVVPVGLGYFTYTSGKDSVQVRTFTDVGSLLVTVKPAVSAPVETRK